MLYATTYMTDWDLNNELIYIYTTIDQLKKKWNINVTEFVRVENFLSVCSINPTPHMYI